MYFSWLSLVLLIVTFSCSAQKGRKLTDNLYTIAFYNVENLFDTIDNPGVIDEAFLPQSDKRWNAQRYQDKLEKIASVIGRIGKDAPDVVGLAEVENRGVLVNLVNSKSLKKHHYQIVHYNSPDRRGIDVAFLYKKKSFHYISSQNVKLSLEGDTSFRSRDLLIVKGEIQGQEIHFMIAHWPSRRGGSKQTNHKRVKAAKVARGIIDSLLAINDKANVVLMGDFNDDPQDQSIKEVLKTTSNTNNLTQDLLYNPFTAIHQPKSKGTLEWRGRWNLFDQIILSPSLMNKNTPFTFQTAYLYDKPFLKVPSGKYKGHPFRTYAGSKYLGGYSDHFPVYLLIKVP